jgi:uncharacterized membrane protein
MASECNDMHKALHNSQLQHSEAAAMKLLDVFRQFQNRLKVDGGDNNELYCLSSGQPASDKVQKDLVSYVDASQEAAKVFVETRLFNHSDMFHETMKRRNFSTFKSMAAKKSLSTTQKKTNEVRAERNLFCLIFVALGHYISLVKLSEYPLGPIPWSPDEADVVW